MSCEALKSLFKNEDKHGGEATVEAVQLIAELVKIRHCRLRPSVLEVHSYFLCFSESFVCFYRTGLFNRAFSDEGSLLP
jgi:nucleolar complex protein 3